jgi:signal transduction histidine kinase
MLQTDKISISSSEKGIDEPRRLILVDDNADFAISLADILAARGIETEIAHDVDSALNMVQTFKAQMALIDIRLGRANGLELINGFRAIRPEILCIMMTAYAEISTALEALNEGAFGYLRKPIGMQELLTLLNRGFERLDMQRERLQTQEELHLAYEELCELDELKNNIIANVSHELRTPLVSIKGYVELLLSEIGGNEKYKRWLSVALSSSKRLELLIADILEASMIQSKTMIFDFSPLRLEVIIEGCIDELQRKAKDKGIEFVFSHAPMLPQIRADERKMTIVFNNIFENAIKFSPDGSKIETLMESDRDDWLQISIKDDGIGIPKKYQRKVFSRFFQVDSSSTREYSGFGLGLSIVKEIVIAHGGEVNIESESGRGTRFVVRLPVFEEERNLKPL